LKNSVSKFVGMSMSALFCMSLSAAALASNETIPGEEAKEDIQEFGLETNEGFGLNDVIVAEEETGAVVVEDGDAEVFRAKVDMSWKGITVYFNKNETTTLADLGIAGGTWRCAKAFKEPRVSAGCALIVGAGGLMAKHAIAESGCVGAKWWPGMTVPFIHKDKKYCK
jgi:hypothetical protein